MREFQVNKENKPVSLININDVLSKVPIFSKSNLEYYRDEKEGYATIIPKKHPETRETIINPTARFILELCNGNMNVNGIRNYMAQLYGNIPENTLMLDLINTLFNFSRLGVIEWKEGGNPLVFRFEKEIENGFRIVVAQEDDIMEILDFLNKSFTKDTVEEEGFICYINPFKSITDYNEIALRQQLFAFEEEYFLLKNGGVIEGLMSVVLPAGSKSSSASIGLMFLPVFALPGLLSFCAEILPSISVKNLTKIRFSARLGNSMDEGICTHLTSYGFNDEGISRKEIGTMDIINLALYINQ